MNNTFPLVTVIIPTYNRADKLGTAIDSVLNQTYPHIQLLVIDDGSTDATSRLMQSYPQVSYLVQEHAGQAAARNNGLAHAKGTIIASLDSDDLWYPDFLERCVAKLTNDDLDFVFANWDQETKEGTDWDFLERDPYLTPYFYKATDLWINLTYAELRKTYLEACPSPSSSVVMKKSAIVAGWDTRMNIADDWLIYLDMIFHGSPKAAFTLQRLWRKRVDDINIFDGRKWSEVLQLLYIDDNLRIKEKFRSQLTPKENRMLSRRSMRAMIELSKYYLIRDFNPKKLRSLLVTSLSTDAWYTIRTFFSVYISGVARKVRLKN